VYVYRYIYIHRIVYVYIYIHRIVYVYIYIERERERDRQSVTIPNAVYIQFDLLMMSILLLETCR